MKRTEPQPRFVVCVKTVCVNNKDYPASLELRKLYQVVADEAAAKHHQLRVIDESGEDYLSPEEYFARVQLPQAAEKAVSKNTVFQVSGSPPIEAAKLLDSPQLASSLLSTACMRVFQGDADMRSTARNLDYFAYGPQVSDSAAEISKSIMKLVGDREVGDLGEATTEEQ